MITYRCCECGEECGLAGAICMEQDESGPHSVRYEVSDCCKAAFDEEIVSGTDSLSETARLRVNREMEEE